jgi:hypothetical protein
MRVAITTLLLLAAVPARAQLDDEVSLPMRRALAMPQRSGELGVVAGLSLRRLTYASGSQGFRFSFFDDVPVDGATSVQSRLALELGLSDRFELDLSTLVLDDLLEGSQAPSVLASLGVGVRVGLVQTRGLAISAAVEGSLPPSSPESWGLTPSLQGALLMHEVLAEAGAFVAIRNVVGSTAVNPLFVTCGQQPECYAGPLPGARATLGFTAAASWILGPFMPGVLFAADGLVAQPSASADPFTRTAVEGTGPGAAVRFGPRLQLLPGERFTLQAAVPLGLTPAAPSWAVEVALRVDADLSSPPERF